MKRAVLFVGGSQDAATIPRPPDGPRLTFRVRKKTTWVEDLHADVYGGYGDQHVETYELRQFGFTLDGRLERVYEIYVHRDTPYHLTDKSVAEVIEHLRGIQPIYEKLIPVKNDEH